MLDGEGLMKLGGERYVGRRQDVIHSPPVVEHAICNSGLQGLVFRVITTPPTDARRPPRHRDVVPPGVAPGG
jgi:mannose-6-phosphate isomerase-like protein (cupin superfamily)